MNDREQLVREAEDWAKWFEAQENGWCDNKARLLRRLLSLLPKEGEVVVPVEPTEEMLKEGDLFFTNASFVSVEPAQLKAIYKAMIAAIKEKP